jgi:hypothetical protein
MMQRRVSQRFHRRVTALAALVIVAGLAGCGERDQSLNASAAKPDGQGWQGAQNGFVAPGYQPGDKTRWQTQLRQRAQTQNEYVKTN